MLQVSQVASFLCMGHLPQQELNELFLLRLAKFKEKPSGFGIFVVGTLSITDSLRYSLLAYSDPLCLHNSILVNYIYPKIYLFLLNLLPFGCLEESLMTLCISMESVVIASFFPS